MWQLSSREGGGLGLSGQASKKNFFPASLSVQSIARGRNKNQELRNKERWFICAEQDEFNTFIYI